MSQKTVLCPRCGGCGEEYAGEPETACHVCGGTGEMADAASEAHTEAWKEERKAKAEKIVAFFTDPKHWGDNSPPLPVLGPEGIEEE